mgnify:CR=1 FL=1
MSRVAFIALGSNLGDRLDWLARAVLHLSEHPQIEVLDMSAAYETEPMYITDQPGFLNACAKIKTDLAPYPLLKTILDIENQLGRKRDIDKGPRTLDLDLLFMDDLSLNIPELTLPHPHIHERPFVLVPLNDIAPDFIHPILNTSIAKLLQQLGDTQDVIKLSQESLALQSLIHKH